MDIKDRYTEVFLKAADQDYEIENVKKHRALWWWNLRGKNQGGLRLTEVAIEFIKNQAGIKTYEITLPKDFEFTPQILLWLDQYLDSPFYISKKSVIVMKEIAALELILLNGDIKKLGFNRAMSKRLNQESEL
jgi:hypothetical protein